MDDQLTTMLEKSLSSLQSIADTISELRSYKADVEESATIASAVLENYDDSPERIKEALQNLVEIGLRDVEIIDNPTIIEY